jgi:O-antigen/teichoic acid export membrane protein
VKTSERSGRLRWWKDALLVRIYQNASWLLGGRMGASLLALVSTAITARALGPESFGHLALITAYVLVIDRLVNFQSWQMVIKYGADALEGGKDGDLKGLLKFGTMLDAVTALAGTVVGVFGVALVGSWLGWGADLVFLGGVYSLVILFHVSGTPIAILRLFDRFDLLAASQVAAAAIQLLGVLVVFAIGGGLREFLVVWGVMDVFGKLLLVMFGWLELRRRSIIGVRAASLRGLRQRFPGIWPFVWATNLNASVRMASREIDILVIGAVLGSTATGLYKIAKQFASVLSKLTDPLYQAVFPEIARLTALRRYERLKQVMFRSAASAGLAASLVWLLFVIFGGPFLTLVVGMEYLEAYPVLVWYMLALLLAVFAFPLQPAILALGFPSVSFWIQLASTAVYFSALIGLMKIAGLPGAGLAYVVYYATWATAMWFAVRWILGQHRSMPDGPVLSRVDTGAPDP